MKNHIYLTGDTHRDFDRVQDFCDRHHTTKNDVMFIMGDAGVNYFGSLRDDYVKKYLEEMPITFVFVRGNHESRPVSKQDGGMYTRESKITAGGNVSGTFLWEEMFPSLLFTVDCTYYDLIPFSGAKASAYVMGGAYSVDKDYRLKNHWQWFADEQLSEDERKVADFDLRYKKPDLIFSHTCPYSVRPVDKFLPMIKQETVDNTMELWMDEINKDLNHPRWFCGHWHTDRTVDNVRFLYNDIIEL